MFSSVPTLLWVREVNWEMKLHFLDLPPPCTVDFNCKPKDMLYWLTLTCFSPQRGAAMITSFSGFKKGLPHEYLGRWSVYLALLTCALDYAVAPTALREGQPSLSLLLWEQLHLVSQFKIFLKHQIS